MNSTNKNILEVLNPYSLEVIDTIPFNQWEDINPMLDKAVALYRDRTLWIPAFRRIEILKKAASLMEGRFEELAFQIANEGGKPLIDARVEVTRAIDGIGLCIHEIGQMAGKQIPMDLTAAGAGRIAFTQREPIGPVVAASAFNHPLNLIVHQVAPAIAVGCPVIVKPAADTPLSCRTFVDILYEAGLPQEWCRFVICDNETAEKMITDPRVAFFSFIGSARIGWMLRSKLAPGTRCALEHGGAAPVIIDESADIESMVPLLAKGGFYHSGQVCVSVQRIFAPRHMAEDVARRLAKEADTLIVGNAINEDVQCGPLIRPKEVDRIKEWVEEARQLGAEIITGGKPCGPTTFEPTVLLDPPPGARVSTTEIFGPVVCVYSYDSLDEAYTYANSLPYAFQASVFTKNLDTAMHAIQNLDATAVMVNDHTAFRVDWMPFAGRKQSGYNTGGIGYTMHDMTQDKMAVIKF